VGIQEFKFMDLWKKRTAHASSLSMSTQGEKQNKVITQCGYYVEIVAPDLGRSRSILARSNLLSTALVLVHY
jgi:hypothetical protein